jgi:hypothetical protein
METSILNSTKKVLGVDQDDHSFDLDILTYINSALSTVTDLGVGPPTGVAVEDETTDWSELGEELVILSKVKTYVFLRVRMLFDPPATSYLVTAMENQIQSHEWRLNENREQSRWVNPDPPEVIVE